MLLTFQPLKSPHISKSLSKKLKMLQSTPQLIYFINKVTGHHFITYSKSYDIRMMLDILSRICLTLNLSKIVPSVLNESYPIWGKKTCRIRICNNIFPLGMILRVFWVKNHNSIFSKCLNSP